MEEQANIQQAKALMAQGEWAKAAVLWNQLDRLGQMAFALEQQAMQLSAQAIDAEITATAWDAAAQAYAEISQKGDRARCEREAARHQQLPILIPSVQAKPMRLSGWSRLNYTIHNVGFGSARRIQVNVIEEGNFVGQTRYTKTAYSIRPEKMKTQWLEILPQAYGSEVPLRLLIEFEDRHGSRRDQIHTAYLQVSQFQPLNDQEQFATLVAPQGANLIMLRQNIARYFSGEELHTLLFDLNLHPDNFSTKPLITARELILFALQNGRFQDLLFQLETHRPHVNWQ